MPFINVMNIYWYRLLKNNNFSIDDTIHKSFSYNYIIMVDEDNKIILKYIQGRLVRCNNCKIRLLRTFISL